MRAYSEDLRKKVANFVKTKGSQQEASEAFGISRTTIYRWFNLEKESGSLKRRKRTKHRSRRFTDAALKKYVSENPSATLKQMAKHFKVTVTPIFYRLKLLNITRKKNNSVF